MEFIYEIQLHPVQSILPQKAFISTDQVFPHRRIPGIQNTSAIIRVIGQQLIGELRPNACMNSYIGHAEPHHALHTQLVNLADRFAKVRKFSWLDPPISAIGIAPVVVCRLPAIVDNDRPHTQCSSTAALFYQRIAMHLLVPGIPGGIDWLPGALWCRKCCDPTFLPPVYNIVQYFTVPQFPVVDSQKQTIILLTVQWNLNTNVQRSILFVDTGVDAMLFPNLGETERAAIESAGIIKCHHWCRAGSHVLHRRVPVGFDTSIHSAAGMPKPCDIQHRHFPFE